MVIHSNEKIKLIIGLTGNIGSGKSVVRRMLENKGALGIDADALSHRVLMPHCSGYASALRRFGDGIRDDRNGLIDRPALGRIVFADPTALQDLENIVHPLVDQAVNWLIEKAVQPVIVVEAIKLLESSLVNRCDSIWVVDASENIRLKRLVQQRGMRPDDALKRIKVQEDPELKIKAANVVIQNEYKQENTWRQVDKFWQETIPGPIQDATGEVWYRIYQNNQSPFYPAIWEDADSIKQFLAERTHGENGDIQNRLWDEKILIKKTDAEISALMEYKVDNLACVLSHLEFFQAEKGDPQSTLR